MDRRRVVEVHGERSGSGFLLADGLVLTAAHLLFAAGRILGDEWAACEVAVRPAGGGVRYAARCAWARYEGPHRGLDAALLEITGLGWTPVTVARVRVGRLAGSAEARVHAFGFPDAVVRDGVAELSPVTGTVHTDSGAMSGRPEIVVDGGEPQRGPGQASLWAGLSGGPVFAAPGGVTDDVLLGIIVGDPAEFASRRLRMIPAPAVLADPVAATITERHCGRLAVISFPRPGSIVSLTGLRRVWGDVPPRNPGFIGRESVLASMRSALLGGGRAVAQALHGMGGVGKTQLAAEYAHQYADEYEVVWWIEAEQAALMGDQFARLAAELGCAEPAAPLAVVQRTVMAELRERERWLLIFDNAVRADDIARWLPARGGHVLITSRAYGWDEIAVPVEVDVLARHESAVILRNRLRGLSEAEADLFAAAVGDLPIAVVQASQFMAESGIPADQYADLLRDRAADVQQPLVAQTQVTFDRLQDKDPAAADLAIICAWLAPDSIPASWFCNAAIHLPGPLGASAADPVSWRQVVASLTRSTLARREHEDLAQHRLVQSIIRGPLAAGRAAEMREAAGLVLAANHPGDPGDPGNWPAWGRMVHHLVAVGPGDASSTAVKKLAVSATWYLTRRGNASGGRDLALQLRDRWQERFGPDDDFTLRAANNLADALRDLDRFREARDLDKDTLTRRRRVLGDDDRNTLISASNLAIDLRELDDSQAARELDEVTLQRRRELFGEDDPDTLSSASNLAIDLYNLGDVAAARALNEETLARRRRVLGEDNFYTLVSACNLANTLFDSGELQAACELDQDTLARRQRVLGVSHLESLLSAVQPCRRLHRAGDLPATRRPGYRDP